MTDEEIIRILEGCWIPNGGLCNECPYIKDEIKGERFCSDALMDDVLSLVNRQKAELERLRTDNMLLSQKRASIFETLNAVEKARVDAIKNFAEALKAYKEYIEFPWDGIYVNEEIIDSLVEEMVGSK